MIDDKRLKAIEANARTTRTAHDVRDLVAEVRRLREIVDLVEKRIGLNVTRAWVYGDHDSMREIALAVAKWRGVEQIARS